MYVLNVLGYINGSNRNIVYKMLYMKDYVSVVIPGSEEAGETQDEDRGTEDG